MSNNPQWKSFQPPIMNSDTAILDYKSMTISNNQNSSPNFHSSSPNGTSFHNGSSSTSNHYAGGIMPPKESTSPNNQYQQAGMISPKDSPNNAYSPKSGSTNHFSSNYNAYPALNSSRSAGRFHIGTFSTNEGTNNLFNGESISNTPTNSSSYTEVSQNNQGTRETGIIEKLLHSYGFIQCCERQARLFFHFSQFNGNIEHLKIGDPVEFEMTYDRRTGKPIASAVTKIAPEVVMSEERVTGTVTTEVRTEGSGDTQGRISYENRGECFFLPYNKDDVEGNVTLRSGDKVSFQIAANQRGNLGACHIRLENPAHPVKYQGVVCSMKDNFGFIERADVVKEIFFHFSEAKSMKEDLRLGDDVEFIILTRNGKEVACNITRLESGSVIFEDVSPETVKGQVLKPLERGGGSQSRHQNDPLPGRIRYRAPDHSEVEIPFGDKDQRGDFTLKHGDWVQFRIATDRRDQLQRATNILLLDESFLVSGERREQGLVVLIKDGYGFLRCVDRDTRLFFHFNEILDVDRGVIVDDEVEFTVIQDQSSFSNNRQSAIRIKHLAQGTVRFETPLEQNLKGYIYKEASYGYSPRSPSKSQSPGNGSEKSNDYGIIHYQEDGNKKTIYFYSKDCDSKNYPRTGDKVEFNISQVKRNKELIATEVQVIAKSQKNGVASRSNNYPLCQGFIAALKDSFGFIETLEHDREVFFHFSNFEGDANTLDLGLEVEYNLATRGSSGSCLSAENVRILPRGTIVVAEIEERILDGTVDRPLRSVNPDQTQYAGLIVQNFSEEDDEEEDEEKARNEYEFGITSLANKRELLQMGDPVTFQVDREGRAANIVAVRKKRKATVDAVKGHFGFLTYEVDEGKKLFFHISEVKDDVTLQQGDQVEFVLVTNKRTGKSSACNVTKVSSAARQERPERLISRLRTISLDDSGPKLTVVRQPRGPDGSKGFNPEFRAPRAPGTVLE